MPIFDNFFFKHAKVMQTIQKTEKNLGSGRGCLRGSAGVEGVAEGQISYIYQIYH